jgi:hypothetical protein
MVAKPVSGRRSARDRQALDHNLAFDLVWFNSECSLFVRRFFEAEEADAPALIAADCLVISGKRTSTHCGIAGKRRHQSAGLKVPYLGGVGRESLLERSRFAN